LPLSDGRSACVLLDQRQEIRRGTSCCLRYKDLVFCLHSNSHFTINALVWQSDRCTAWWSPKLANWLHLRWIFLDAD